MLETKHATVHSLQVLRGLACLLVMFFHAGESCRIYADKVFLLNFFRSANAGVDLFFVLSGFIIMYSSADQSPSFKTAGRFWWNRLIRIYPIYWICISVFLLAQVSLPHYFTTPFPRTAANLTETFLLLPGHTSLNGVSWTLPYELLFYALFSIALLIRARKIRLLVTGVLLAGSIAGLVFPQTWLWYVSSLLLYPMNFEFLLGVLAARSFRLLPLRSARWLLLTGLIAFIVAASLYDPHQLIWNAPLDSTTFYSIPAFLIIISLAAIEYRSRITYPKILSKIGDASYSLYLIHVPVIAAFVRLLPVSRWPEPAVNLVVTLFLIILTMAVIAFYQLVERPMLDWLKRQTPMAFRKPVSVHVVTITPQTTI